MRELKQMGAEMRRENSVLIKTIVREAVVILDSSRVDIPKPKKKGRKQMVFLNLLDKRQIQFLHSCGLSVKEISHRFKVSTSTVRKVVF
jgi:DNA-binding NarL/FixJ family response regulator